MVKHGRDKKRRAGRTGRTRLKTRAWNRWDPKPKICDPVVKEHWDAAKSATANLESMGLLARPNQLPSNMQRPAVDLEKQASVVELFDVPDSDAPSRISRFPLDKEEETFIAGAMGKYGEEYIKMFRDLKVNKMQYTENQLRKMGARFLLLAPQQRRVDVPEKVKPLLPADSGGAD